MKIFYFITLCLNSNYIYNNLNLYLKSFKGGKNRESFTINVASSYGYLQVIKWLHKTAKGRDEEAQACTTDAMDYASMNGHLQIVKWLYKNKGP